VAKPAAPTAVIEQKQTNRPIDADQNSTLVSTVRQLIHATKPSQQNKDSTPAITATVDKNSPTDLAHYYEQTVSGGFGL